MSKTKSAILKEAWYNPTIGDLTIIDRKTGRVQTFKLKEEYTELRYRINVTDEEKQQLAKEPEGHDTETDPADVFGSNGWKRMRRLEECE